MLKKQKTIGILSFLSAEKFLNVKNKRATNLKQRCQCIIYVLIYISANSKQTNNKRTFAVCTNHIPHNILFWQLNHVPPNIFNGLITGHLSYLRFQSRATVHFRRTNHVPPNILDWPITCHLHIRRTNHVPLNKFARPIMCYQKIKWNN